MITFCPLEEKISWSSLVQDYDVDCAGRGQLETWITIDYFRAVVFRAFTEFVSLVPVLLVPTQK